jgi:hypothetical protein
MHSGDKRNSRKDTPPTDRLLSLDSELNESTEHETIDELYQVSWDAIERAQRDRKLRESQQMHDHWSALCRLISVFHTLALAGCSTKRAC